MASSPPVDIPFPLSTFPGANTQESAGRLLNCYSEPLGDPQQQGKGAPKNAIVWRRMPGLTQFAKPGYGGYRGGLIVSNTSYECFANRAVTVDAAGTVTDLGAFPGTKPASIARNQASPITVMAVDIDNGAYILSGGGAPSNYTGAGNLPQPNSCCYQKGYFFFSIADGRIFSTGVNDTTINTQTYTQCLSKSDIVLYRVIAYQEYLLAFTSGSCEVFQDQANPYPTFPYTRQVVLPNGLLQPTAIAGDETGFDDLLFVSHDFAVWQIPQNTLSPRKVSPPDLDRLIEAANKAGDMLKASVYIFAGRKVWVLQSSSWTWEFHLVTQKWHERSSLQSSGNQGRWRGTGGHLAFGKWLIGDEQTQTLLYLDSENYYDCVVQDEAVTTFSPMLWQVDSGAVERFPERMRVPRSDFFFVAGVGRPQRQWSTSIADADSGTDGVVSLEVTSTLGFVTGDTVIVSGVAGTTEANGTWATCTVVDETHIEIPAVFANAYTSGGTITDVSVPHNVKDPQVAIYWSDDGGNRYRNPVLRSLGEVGNVETIRVSVKNTGMTGQQGRRWRLRVSDPVYTALFGGSMCTDPTVVS